jgi:hypothetical protein
LQGLCVASFQRSKYDKPDLIKDSGSGFQFYKLLFKNTNLPIITAGGKDNLANTYFIYGHGKRTILFCIGQLL